MVDEHRPSQPRVAGSNPAGRTIFLKNSPIVPTAWAPWAKVQAKKVTGRLQRLALKYALPPPGGCVATLKSSKRPTWFESTGAPISGSHPEQFVDALNLPPNIRTAHPPYLPLPDHVHRLISLNRSPSRVKFAKALRGLSLVV